MKGFVVTAALGLLLGVQALPAPAARVNSLVKNSPPHLQNVDVANVAQGEDPAAAIVDAEEDPAAVIVEPEEDPAQQKDPKKVKEDKEAEAEAEANEQEVEAEFDVAVAVEGGDLKQDLLFTKVATGQFELEFQNDEADEITVTENKIPNGVAPAGFEFIEVSSFSVAFAVSQGLDLTLSKVDFIFDVAAPELEGKDITQAQVGKLCAETGAFVIAESLGELEFEAEENEVTLNLNKNVTAEGEFAFFVPIIVAAEDPAAAEDLAAVDEAAAKEEEKAAKKDKEAKKGPKADQAAAVESENVDVIEDPKAAEHEVVEDLEQDPAAAEHVVPAEEVGQDQAKVHPPPPAPHRKQRDEGNHSHKRRDSGNHSHGRRDGGNHSHGRRDGGNHSY